MNAELANVILPPILRILQLRRTTVYECHNFYIAVRNVLTRDSSQCRKREKTQSDQNAVKFFATYSNSETSHKNLSRIYHLTTPLQIIKKSS